MEVSMRKTLSNFEFNFFLSLVSNHQIAAAVGTEKNFIYQHTQAHISSQLEILMLWYQQLRICCYIGNQMGYREIKFQDMREVQKHKFPRSNHFQNAFKRRYCNLPC